MMWLLLLFCGLTSAQITSLDFGSEAEVCSPNMCAFLKEFGAMKEKLTAVETKLQESENQIRELKSTAQVTSSDFGSEAEVCSPNMCAFLKEIGAMKEKLTAVETKQQESENQIHEMKSKEQTKVIFSAAIGGDSQYTGPFDNDTILIFKTAITNIGNAYNTATGVFTAPVSGAYYFTLFYNTGGQHGTYLDLYKNSQMIIVAAEDHSDNDPTDVGGNAVFVQLKPGDQVYLKLRANKHVWGNNYMTTFSGFLVTQM